MSKTQTPKTDLRSPIFNDDDAARSHLETLLWPHGPQCPRCGVLGDRITKMQGKSTRPGVYNCKDCRKPFSVTVGTIMERSHIPLSKWVLAAQLMASSKKSMSALQLHRMLGTNYETAWFLFHRLREAATDPTPSPLGGEGKVIEADETYIGGKEGNKHASKRRKYGKRMGGAVDKAPVAALVERGGSVRSFHLATVNARNLREILVTNAKRESRLMTDELGSYRRVGREFAKHDRVRHGDGQYVIGDAHTNTIEGYFSIFKRAIYGQFHSISEAHLQRYLAEADFKYNTRKISDSERADELLRGAKGKRLVYRQPDQASHA